MRTPTPSRFARLSTIALVGAMALASAGAGEPPAEEEAREPARVSLPTGTRLIDLGPRRGHRESAGGALRRTLARSGAGGRQQSEADADAGPKGGGRDGGGVVAGGGDKGFEWTQIEPSPDSRVVYVSASEGSDANGGLEPDEPVRTIAKGRSLLRDGFPDHLLLKRGDVWEDEDFGRWKLSGRSEAEPMVVGAYGEGVERPLVRTGTANRGFWLDGGQIVEHVAIMGIELHAHTYQGEGGAEAGILFLGGGGDVLIEDCLIRGYKDNLVFNGFGSELTDLTVRGCVVVDSFSKIAHAQGLYAAEVDGLLVEGCVFDHNGWSEEVAGADPTVFNHNVYVQTNSSDVTVRNNLVMNGSSHGIQLRPGGVCEGNVILYNAIGVLSGNAGDAPPVEVMIKRNVIMHGDDITPDKPRGMGIDLQHVSGGQVVENLLAHNESAQPYGHAIKLHSGPSSPVDGLRIAGNTIYDWQGGLKLNESDLNHVRVVGNVLQSEDASVPIIEHEGDLEGVNVRYANNVYHSNAMPVAWFQVGVDTYNFGAWQEMTGDEGSASADLQLADPQRSVATYQAAVGGEAGLDGFIEAVRAQSRLTWDDDYAVPAIREYLRAGYGSEGTMARAAEMVDQ